VRGCCNDLLALTAAIWHNETSNQRGRTFITREATLPAVVGPPEPTQTEVVLLGTAGGPNPKRTWAGIFIAVGVGNFVYLDASAPEETFPFGFEIGGRL